jgi:hypothetical protein
MKTFKQFLRDPGTPETQSRAVRLSTQRRRQVAELFKKLKSARKRTATA